MSTTGDARGVHRGAGRTRLKTSFLSKKEALCSHVAEARARSSGSVGRRDREAQTPVRGAVTPGGPRRLQLRFAPRAWRLRPRAGAALRTRGPHTIPAGPKLVFGTVKRRIFRPLWETSPADLRDDRQLPERW